MKIGNIGIATIAKAIAKGLADATIIDGDRNTWFDQVDLNEFSAMLSFGVREKTIVIDTGYDVFRIDITHVQRLVNDEGR